MAGRYLDRGGTTRTFRKSLSDGKVHFSTAREAVRHTERIGLKRLAWRRPFAPPHTPAELLAYRDNLLDAWNTQDGYWFFEGWLRASGAQSIDGDTIDVDHNFRNMLKVFAEADPYIVAPDIGDLLAAGARSLPEGVAVNREDLISPVGMIVFERPAQILPEEEFNATEVVVWVDNAHDPHVPKDRIGRERIVVMFLSRLSRTETAIHGLDPSLLETVRAPMIDAIYSIRSGQSWDEARDDPQRWQPQEGEADCYEPGMRWFASLVTFLKQQILVSETRHIAERQLRRARERDNKPTSVGAITLRKRAPHPHQDAADEPRAVEWSCQWLVNGHWRNQYYRSTGENRPIWISPYIKGPDGLPFRAKERVFVVAR